MKKKKVLPSLVLVMGLSMVGCSGEKSTPSTSEPSVESENETKKSDSASSSKSENSLEESSADYESSEKSDKKSSENSLESVFAVSETVEVSDSPVKSAFDIATDLSMYQLTTKNGRYYYKTLVIQSEDEEWLNSSLNSNKSVEPGSLYRTLATYLDGYDLGITGPKLFSETLFGRDMEAEELAPYVANAQNIFIDDDNPGSAILQHLQLINSMNVSFDPNTMNFHIDIPDLTQTSSELGISHEALGYLLAELTEYGATVTFDKNSAVVDRNI